MLEDRPANIYVLIANSEPVQIIPSNEAAARRFARQWSERRSEPIVIWLSCGETRPFILHTYYPESYSDERTKNSVQPTQRDLRIIKKY